MVSIITPVYNAAEYLPETIKMVQEQTCKDWELMLIDDCSGDKSCQVIEELLGRHPDNRIRLLRQEENQGAVRARNRGLK